MFFDVGDFVSRNSYNNDTIFEIIKIEGNKVYLKGVNIRLYADSDIEDLKSEDKKKIEGDEDLLERTSKSFSLDRNEYFYLPGKILHIDTDIHLSNNHLNPYKIRKKAKIQKYINHQKKQKMSKI